MNLLERLLVLVAVRACSALCFQLSAGSLRGSLQSSSILRTPSRDSLFPRMLGNLFSNFKAPKLGATSPAVGRPKKVKFGALEVSEMGIGTWSWGNQLLWGYDPSMDPEIQQVFDLCVDKGVTLFDTGDSYGTGKLNGQAEKLLGKFMSDYAAKNGGKRPYVGTKFATYPWRLTADSLVNACKESSARLERPVDIGQIHWPAANYAPWQERALWDGLVKMYKEARTAENFYSTDSQLYLKHV